MAVDRTDLVAALGVPELQPRASILPSGLDELPQPAQPDWAASPLPMRREQAAQAIADAFEGAPPTLRVAMPEGHGYRLVFAHLRRDWRAVRHNSRRVGPSCDADCRLTHPLAACLLAGMARQIAD